MKIYLVGGAVRDKLLSIPIKEKDWVVVGSSLEEMIKLGYKKVGKSFPVFLHPISHEEYALARIDKKIGYGYYGFSCYFSSKVTLEEDLYRRDLTINAIAQDDNGNFIDPYNGIYDLKNKIIRHISYNFIDDPLRVLRVARFYAYLYNLNFKINKDTLNLMKIIVKNNELSYLSKERIWKETDKALLTNNPVYYFKILYECEALNIIFPEILLLIKLSNNFKLNINKIFKRIKKIKKIKLNSLYRFSSMFYIISLYIIKYNKIKKKEYITNLLNNKKEIFITMCNRLKLSNNIKNIISLIIENSYFISKIEFLNINEIIILFYKLKLNKNIENLKFILEITFIDKNIKNIYKDSYNNFYNKKQFLLKIWELINSIKLEKIIINKYKGKSIKKIIYYKQDNLLKNWVSNLLSLI